MRIITFLGWSAICLAALNLQPAPSVANDSSAELSVGGLVFVQNSDVSIESEHLTITPETVTVRYRFLNRSKRPVTLTVAFPLPDIDLAEAENIAFPHDDPVNFVGFASTIDGKPITFDIHQRAFLGDKEVTAAINSSGLRFLPLGDYRDRINALAPDARDRLVAERLLVQAGSDASGRPLFEPAWITKTSVVRQQAFPPGREVSVEHRYRTSTGISFDTVLRKGLRENKNFEAEVQRYRADYCVDSSFLRGIDRIAGASEANDARLTERRISYVLTTGANWSGPIKDFTLVVDKGHPKRLVSFCLRNVTKISPTAFRVQLRDFMPTTDLKLLFIAVGE